MAGVHGLQLDARLRDIKVCLRHKVLDGVNQLLQQVALRQAGLEHGCCVLGPSWLCSEGHSRGGERGGGRKTLCRGQRGCLSMLMDEEGPEGVIAELQGLQGEETARMIWLIAAGCKMM